MFCGIGSACFQSTMPVFARKFAAITMSSGWRHARIRPRLFIPGASSMMTRLHLYLILEIALVYGKDLDDKARVSEMAAVVAATGLSVAAPMLVKMFGLHPLYTLPVGGLAAKAATQLIGNTAIKLYSGQLKSYALPAAPVSSSAASASVSQ